MGVGLGLSIALATLLGLPLYQLAYFPIAHITSLAFADGAFENARVALEFLHKLRVPARLHVLPPI